MFRSEWTFKCDRYINIEDSLCNLQLRLSIARDLNVTPARMDQRYVTGLDNV